MRLLAAANGTHGSRAGGLDAGMAIYTIEYLVC